MRSRKAIIGAAVLALVAGTAWFADRQLKHRDHPGLVTFIKQVARNYPASFNMEPVELVLNVKDEDLAELQRVVEEARERGVILPEGRDYVPAEITGPEGTFKAKVRIKGKMTDHVKGSKWSFRVVAKKDGGFLGMQRFSLQHPGTRNYLCDWFFHRLSAGEGMTALRYGFIRLSFNGEDLGVYAYEEHFGPELLAHNGRVKGPVFRFDPSLFWVHRLNEMRKVKYDEAFAAYQAASLDAFGTGDLEKDSLARAQFAEACGLIDGFRRGELRASEVFNVELLARRHALLDLVGGHHSMDWSDVKFYYDPVLRRVEPVAYESFSAHPIRNLAGSWRYVGRQRADMDLHDAYFNDPELFKAYVRALERLARPSYLDSAFAALKPALDSAAATIYREFPYKELDRSIYYANQRTIQRLLDVPKGFHAYLQQRTADSVVVAVVPIEALPMEVKGLVLANGKVVAPVGNVIVPSRKQGQVGAPITMRFKLGADMELPAKDLAIRYSVLGASVTKELEVFAQALPLISKPLLPAAMSLAELAREEMIAVDTAASVITIRPGRWVLDHDLSLPPGFTVKATAPLHIDLRNGARIISRAPLEWRGLEDAPIVINSGNASGGGLRVVDPGGPSVLAHVRIEGLGPADGTPAMVFHAADLRMTDCALAGDPGRDLLTVVRGTTKLERVLVRGGRDQLSLYYTKATLTGVQMDAAADEAMVVHGGVVDLQGVRMALAKGVGIKAGHGAVLNVRDGHLDANGNGLEIGEGSVLRLEGGSVRSGATGIVVRKVERYLGPSRVEVKGVEITGTEAPLRSAEGNTVLRDGQPWSTPAVNP